MAPVLQFHGGVADFGEIASSADEAARMNRAAWRQAPHGFAVGTPKGSESAVVRAEA
jgi:hypothetical protein